MQINNLKNLITKLLPLFFAGVVSIIGFLIIQSNISIKNNTIVIVRSIGERTETKSIERLEKIFGKKNIYLIKNTTPLIDASKKTFELALKSDKKWALVVDCDVFFFKDKIFIFIKNAKNLTKKDKLAFCFQGKLFDKFSLQGRMTGFYLYYLPNLKYKNEFYNICKNKIRPEACIRDNIEKQGFNAYESSNMVGIHDYFQNRRDIVKKSILHCKKNDIETALWTKNWQELASRDEDFKYALLGYKIFNSLNDKTKENLVPDSNEFDKYIEKYKIENKKEKIKDSEIDEILEKCDTQTSKEALKTPFIKKIKPVVQSY